MFTRINSSQMIKEVECSFKGSDMNELTKIVLSETSGVSKIIGPYLFPVYDKPDIPCLSL